MNKTIELSVGVRDVFDTIINPNKTVAIALPEPDGSVTVCTNTGTARPGNTSTDLYYNETGGLYWNDTVEDDDEEGDDDIRRHLTEQWRDEIIRRLNGEASGDDTYYDNDDYVANENGANANDIGSRDLSSLWVPGQTWRIFMICFCCILIYAYTMYLLWQEWVSNVALRRAFFLEASHYGERMSELNKIDLDLAKSKKVNDNPVVKEEQAYPPYLTHPEIRETPPSISLFSALYQLPNSMVTYGTDGANSVERQLVATKKFFEMVIPSEPGFSSSVIAVTMVPNAKLVATTWLRWTQVEGRLQTLRYIRRLLAKAEMKTKEPSSNSNYDKGTYTSSSPQYGKKDKSKIHTRSSGLVYNDVENNTTQSETTEETNDEATSREKKVFKYENFDVKSYARSLGFTDEVDKISMFVDGMGIEEFNVFAYHCAVLEGGTARLPLNVLSKEKLEAKQKEIEDELDIIHQDLIDARESVITLDDADQKVSSDESLVKPCRFTSTRLIDANDEWRLPEATFTEALKPLESSVGEANKSEGIWSYVKTFFRRVLIGQKIPEFDPKHYGFEEEKNGRKFETKSSHPSYAVVTFASRHSAIIARQCLADGVAANNWMQVKDLPIYPLAEAPQLMLSYPRGYL